MVGAMIAVIPYSANARPRFCGGNVSARMACAMGCRPPPPAPWITRKRSSMLRLAALPQRTEATVNMKMQTMKKRFRPKRLASQPLIGRTMALDTKYDVSTQVLSSLLEPRPPAMYGKATLAMLVSSTSMNAASATTTPMSQGLNFGRHGSVSGGAESTPALSDINFRLYRHARPQPMVTVLVGINIAPDREALHHLHEISRGIFRRQQAEQRTAGATDTGDSAFVFAVVSIHTKRDSLARFHMAQ